MLFASEGGIYSRFGYGLASFLGEIDLEGEVEIEVVCHVA